MSDNPTVLRALCTEPDNYSEAGLAAINQLADLDVRSMGPDELLKAIGDYHLLFVRLRTRVTRDLLAAGSHLRAVISPTTGLNHIDLESAASFGVSVFHLRGQTEFLRSIPSTAEHTWGLLLSLARRIPAAVDSVRGGEWAQEPFRGRELQSKRLGILGFGRLGSIVARYGQAFGMEVLTHDPYVDHVPDNVRKCDTISELLAGSEILSVHVPLNESTVGLIGADELGMLPRGAMLINTSRGEIIDEEALISCLLSGRIAGAAVDVIQREHAVKQVGSPLIEYAREHDNLIVTPHIGGATVEAVQKTDLFLIGKLADWLGSTDSAEPGRSR